MAEELLGRMMGHGNDMGPSNSGMNMGGDDEMPPISPEEVLQMIQVGV